MFFCEATSARDRYAAPSHSPPGLIYTRKILIIYSNYIPAMVECRRDACTTRVGEFKASILSIAEKERHALFQSFPHPDPLPEGEEIVSRAHPNASHESSTEKVLYEGKFLQFKLMGYALRANPSYDIIVTYVSTWWLWLPSPSGRGSG